MLNPFRRPKTHLPKPPKGLDFEWTCSCCGKRFDTLPTDYAFEGPGRFLAMSPEERSRVIKTDDICIVSDDEMYVRGLLSIPILGTDQKLSYGVWCSVSAQTMQYIREHEHKDFAESDPPRFGWLCSWPEGYRPTGHIKCSLTFQNQGLRPIVILEPTDYPLAVEQHNGVTIDHVQRLAAKLLPH